MIATVTMFNECGGWVGPLECVLEDEGVRTSIRKDFGESGLREAEAAARRLIAAREQR